MANLVNPSQRLNFETAVLSLTPVQRALWQLGMPILDARAVSGYKKRAQLGMLWRAVRWQLLGMAALLAIECIGRQWGRVAVVGGAAVTLAALFAWLVNAADLQWRTTGYTTFQSMQTVPPHVSAMAAALLERGVSQEQIRVEYLKSDPILYVEDSPADQARSGGRYNLIIW